VPDVEHDWLSVWPDEQSSEQQEDGHSPLTGVQPLVQLM
jgi:hypothetical protein